MKIKSAYNIAFAPEKERINWKTSKCGREVLEKTVF
jgi:hypothetical protein